MRKILYALTLSFLSVVSFSAHAEIVGSGTAADPYQIASAEDLCNAWTHVSGQPDTEYYFIQTADIDMAGHTDWHAISGHSGLYASIVHYDGQKHVIKNFCPANNPMVADGSYYYCTSLFGVVSGEIRNLGIIDAAPDFSTQGVGILAAYGGHPTAGQLTVDNVFVTGNVASNASYTGGMLGTTGNNVSISNSYANVTVEGQKNTGALIGRLRNSAVIEDVYVAGSVGASNGYSPYLVIGADRSQSLILYNVVAFNTGAELAVAEDIEIDGSIDIATESTKSQLIAEIQTWRAFSKETLFSGYPALNWETGVDEPISDEPKGTMDDPYIITTVEDLCNAYKHINTGGCDVWFKQTADIDMSGVTKWTAIAGYNGTYAAVIHYDGQNHIIKNFAPEDRPLDIASNSYYCTSIFGVVSGEIKNLGIVDANCIISYNFGSGILAAYGGHNTGSTLTLENVFVTGSIDCNKTNYTGGIIGSTGNEITMLNCYANVEVIGAGLTAGLIGRVNHNIALENVYVAGIVSGTNPYLVCGASRTGNSADLFNVIAFNSGSDQAIANDISIVGDQVIVATDETHAQLVAEIQTWEAFNAGKIFKSYPALNWQSGDDLKNLSYDYNGRYLTITSPDNADIYYSINGGDYNRYIGTFDVEGLQTISAFARKAGYTDTTPQGISVHSYGTESYVMLDSDGAFDEAYGWTDSATLDNLLSNTNFLVYVPDNNIASPISDKVSNIIVNGQAEYIRISDEWPWYCPHEFIASTIIYRRDFTKRTAIDGECAGWETIALPFNVETITHNGKEVYSFAENSDKGLALRYWLYQPTATGWTPAAKIEANKPYLIAMPNNEFYDDQFNISGSVQFESTIAIIEQTPADLAYDYINGYRLVANYSTNRSDATKLVVNNDEVEGEEPGSCFAVSARDIRTFEAYLTGSNQNRVRIFETTAADDLMVEMGIKVMTTADHNVCICSSFSTAVKIFDLTGRVVRTVSIPAGETVTVNDLPAGIYIIANTKIAL